METRDVSTETLKTEIVTREAEQSVAVVQRDPNQDASPEWRQVLREAEKLACASLCPSHLKVAMPPIDGTPATDARRRAAWNQMLGNCILVSNQARKWGADTFAVAAESYVVGNKLGYQGKLIAAVVNARAGLSEPIQALYSTGKGDSFAAVIYASEDAITGEEREKMFALLAEYADNEDQKANRELARMGVLTVRVSVGQCKTDNKMWKSDPEQKLFYTGCTKWARRHKPEMMVGILSDDDLEYMRMQERREQHHVQSRVEQVIPATLDASGILPALAPPQESAVSVAPPSEERPREPAPSEAPVASDQAESLPPQQSRQREPGDDDEPVDDVQVQGNGFDADAWTSEFIAQVGPGTRMKHRKELQASLEANKERIGDERYLRCVTRIREANWVL
jgi:hypothetical protein